MKILHLSHDQKFLDSAYKLFEAAFPKSNVFLIYNRSKKLKYVQSKNIKIINHYSFLNKKLIGSLKIYDLVILHSLSNFNLEIVARSESTVKFLWIGMGYDYYDLINENSKQKPSGNLKTKSFELIKIIEKKLFYKNSFNKLEIIKKINLFSPVLENEFKILRKKYPNLFSNKYVHWNYAISSSLVDGDIKIPDRNLTTTKILIGNSACSNNRHLNLFKIIDNQTSGNKEIICPLSYGPKKNIIKIKKLGYQTFKDNFIPITDFMPYSNYLSILSQCANVIMGQHRQQAGGNINASLFLGARVFIDEKNSFYNHYKNLGVTLNSIVDLEKNPELLDIYLSKEERKKNMDILRKNLSFDTALDKTIAIANLI